MKTWIDALIDALEIDDSARDMSDAAVLLSAMLGWIAYAAIVVMLP
jgi:hypothetical protein